MSDLEGWEAIKDLDALNAENQRLYKELIKLRGCKIRNAASRERWRHRYEQLEKENVELKLCIENRAGVLTNAELLRELRSRMRE